MSKNTLSYKQKINLIIKIKNIVSIKQKNLDKTYIDLPPLQKKQCSKLSSTPIKHTHLQQLNYSPNNTQSRVCNITFKNHQEKPQRKIIFATAINPRTTRLLFNKSQQRIDSDFLSKKSDIIFSKKKYATIQNRVKLIQKAGFIKIINQNPQNSQNPQQRIKINNNKQPFSPKKQAKPQNILFKINKESTHYKQHFLSTKQQPKFYRKSLQMTNRKTIFTPWAIESINNQQIGIFID